MLGLVIVLLGATTGCSALRDEESRIEAEKASDQAPVTTLRSEEPSTTTASAPTPQSAGSTVTVTRVVDGDTIEVSSGATVRLTGIDTPERGECGYSEATDLLRLMVLDKGVTLVPGAREDRDRYGRLLRYVEVNGGDVNLEMIHSGRAVARYDSRDGYGHHPREETYVATDAASPDAITCSEAAAPPPTAAASAPRAPATVSGGNADPRFSSCQDAISNGFGPYRRGSDPEYDWYRDGDGDGINCER